MPPHSRCKPPNKCSNKAWPMPHRTTTEPATGKPQHGNLCNSKVHQFAHQRTTTTWGVATKPLTRRLFVVLKTTTIAGPMATTSRMTIPLQRALCPTLDTSMLQPNRTRWAAATKETTKQSCLHRAAANARHGSRRRQLSHTSCGKPQDSPPGEPNLFGNN